MDFRQVINRCIKEAGNQENLARSLDMSPAALCKKISGDSGWYEHEIDKIVEFAQVCSKCKSLHEEEIEAFQHVLATLLNTRGKKE